MLILALVHHSRFLIGAVCVYALVYGPLFLAYLMGDRS